MAQRVMTGVAKMFHEELQLLSKKLNISQMQITQQMAESLRNGKRFPPRISKKGQSDNLVLVIVAFFTLSIAILPAFFILDSFNTEAQSMTEFNNSAGTNLQNVVDAYPAIWDGAAALVLVLLFAALLVSAFLVDSQPIFLVFSIPLFLLTMLVAGFLANVWDAFRTSEPLQPLADQFTIIPFVFENYIIVFSIMGLISLGVLFAKIRSNNGG